MWKARIFSLVIVVVHLAGFLQAQVPRRTRIDRENLERIFQTYGVKRLSVLTTQGHRYLEDPGMIETGAILAVRLDEPVKEEAAAGDLKYVLPYRFGVLQQAGVPTLSLVMVVLVQGGAIEYHPDQQRYVGSLRVGALDEQNPGLIQPLRGVMAQLIINQGGVDPDSIAIETTGLPYKSVATEAGTIKGDNVGLRVIPSFSPDEPLDVTVPVRRPEISILASPERIQGLGLQACRLTVTVPTAYAGGIGKLTLTATKGRLNPEVVEIDAVTGTGTTALYSSGLGNSEVSVLSGDLAASQTVPFVFPYAFIIAAFLGGLAGAIIKGQRSISKVIVSILIGFVVSIGVVFGLNLLKVNLVDIYATRGFSEALLFLIAALGAYVGRLAI